MYIGRGDGEMVKNLRSAVFLVLLAVFVQVSFAASYYVDSVSGDDGYSGLSAGSAWQSLVKVSGTTFSAGDAILFKCGSSWTGELWPKGSGAPGNSITIDMYGDPNDGLPHIAGPMDGVTRHTLKLYNQQYWEINHLDITHFDPTNATLRRHGIYIEFNEPLLTTQVLNHIHLKNLNIHNINGPLDDYNASAIYMAVYGNGNVSTAAWFNDILIEGCQIYDVYTAGFMNYSDYDTRTSTDDMDWTPWTNFVMRNNVFYNISGRALHTRVLDGGLIEYNVAYGNNYMEGEGEEANAFVEFNCDNCVWQYNEVYDHAKYPPEPDGGAYDIDYRCKNCVVQYNYSHDNGMFVMAPCNGGSSTAFHLNPVFRYNISQNENYEVVHVSGTTQGTKFYNNTVYLGPERSNVIIFYHKSWGGYSDDTSYYNNIIYNLSSNSYYDFGSSTNNVFSHNVFYGNHPASEPSDAYKIIDDPKLIAPGAGGIGLDSVGGYMLLPDSPCIDAGMTIVNNGGQDYWGNAVPANGVPDIGAYEYPFNVDDHTPPAPAPLTFAEDPVQAGGNAVTMTVTRAKDPEGFGVQYYFANVTDPNHDSGWQGSLSYTDIGLRSSESYSYKVKARDVSSNYNETGYSAEKSVTTSDNFVFYPEADSYVRGGSYANDNFGIDAIMAIKNNTNNDVYLRRAFLRFDLSGLPSNVRSARLRLYVNRNDAPTSHAVNFVSDDSWVEMAITWNNQPASGVTLDTKVVPVAGSWIEFDVTSQVLTEAAGDGTISLMVHEPTPTTYSLYDSSETLTSGNKPQLVVTVPMSGDLEPDGDVDMIDLLGFIGYWLDSCSGPEWCGGSDMNEDVIVDYADFSKLAGNWLKTE